MRDAISASWTTERYLQELSALILADGDLIRGPAWSGSALLAPGLLESCSKVVAPATWVRVSPSPVQP